ncbi:hypothetical protein [Kushneria indalinina]|uniref:Uncharacterized protein n=1 Tax=Kushneria indalinina DSM 14324 TaxID=1122140 RepID=A0A3D9E0Y0_9GAMM|nr:hypothetical protein [Kushneria indalinina]REC96661.1 hypothetical protein C8D72_0018 [Kushneria indalinina DSM 14324]
MLLEEAVKEYRDMLDGVVACPEIAPTWWVPAWMPKNRAWVLVRVAAAPPVEVSGICMLTWPNDIPRLFKTLDQCTQALAAIGQPRMEVTIIPKESES